MTNEIKINSYIEQDATKTLMTDPTGMNFHIDWNDNLDLFLTELLASTELIVFADEGIAPEETGQLVFKPISRPDSLIKSRDTDLDGIVETMKIDITTMYEVLHYLIAKGALPIGSYIVKVKA